MFANTSFTLIPWASKPVQWYERMWHGIVPWVGKHVLHLSKGITYFRSGSGDKTSDYVELLCYAIISVAATIVWSLADRKRKQYRWLHHWLRVYVRYGVACTMLAYGMSKVIKLQFPYPSLARMIEPLGDFSPMGLLWTFMGASTAYTFFAGTSELLGGVLLLFRRTTTLGAIVTAGVMFNVAMMNFSYDVPVKLLASHLVLMSIFLMAPDLGRLANVLVLNRTAGPRALKPHFKRRWMRIAGRVIKTVAIAYAVFATTSRAIKNQYVYGAKAPKSALYGIWEAEEFTRNGQVVPPLVTDSSRWRKLVFTAPTAMTVQMMDNSLKRYLVEYDGDKKSVTISPVEDAKQKAALAFVRPDTDHLLLEGRVGQDALKLKLRRIDESKFLLVSRGFHWINELPFNR